MPKIKFEQIDQVINRTEVAELLGVSLPTVDEYVRRGCPFIDRGSNGRRWRFSLIAVVQWRIDYLLFGPSGRLRARE